MKLALLYFGESQAVFVQFLCTIKAVVLFDYYYL